MTVQDWLTAVVYWMGLLAAMLLMSVLSMLPKRTQALVFARALDSRR